MNNLVLELIVRCDVGLPTISVLVIFKRRHVIYAVVVRVVCTPWVRCCEDTCAMRRRISRTLFYLKFHTASHAARRKTSGLIQVQAAC